MGLLQHMQKLEDQFLIQRITSNGIQATFRKNNVKLTCVIEHINDTYIKLLFVFLRQLFDYGDNTKTF